MRLYAGNVKLIHSLRNRKNSPNFRSKIIYVDHECDEQKKGFQKLFIDFFRLTSASMIYRIGSARMYPITSRLMPLD